jgi:hypothetical protein
LGTRLASDFGRARQKCLSVPYGELAYVTALAKNTLPFCSSTHLARFCGDLLKFASHLIRVILFFFAPGVRRVCARCAPGVRQAWCRWLSAPQLDVLKLVCKGRAKSLILFCDILAMTNKPGLAALRTLPCICVTCVTTADNGDDNNNSRLWRISIIHRQRCII